jgi:hypothetical protein
MGWLFMSSLDGYASPKAYLDAQYTFANGDGTSEILASALVKMRTWYAACRQVHHKSGQIEVFALVCLVKYNPRDREGLIFGYKDMSETMGPCEAEFPAKILDLLTSTANEYALAWRARCRAAITRRNRPTPKTGDTIVFGSDILFTDGNECRCFVIQIRGRRTIFTNPATGGHYRISRWKDREWSVVPQIDLGRAGA